MADILPDRTSWPLPWWFFFGPLVLLVQLMFAILLYPWYFGYEIGQVIGQENLSRAELFGQGISGSILHSGDVIYDTVFVQTGLEAWAYSRLVDDMRTGAVGEAAFLQAWRGGPTLDTIFDYFLMVCYRLGMIAVMGGFAGVLLITLVIHVLIERRRQRHTFGDTTLLGNLLSRRVIFLSTPFAFWLGTMPFRLSPLFVLILFVLCLVPLAMTLLSLPKQM